MERPPGRRGADPKPSGARSVRWGRYYLTAPTAPLPKRGSAVSIRVMTAVFDRSEATGSDRLVLLVIADRSNDDGAGCFRGRESIARMARVSPATVTRSIARLEELGELVVERRAGFTSLYRITLPGVCSDCVDLAGGSAQSVQGGLLTGAQGVYAPVQRDTSLDVLDTSEGAPARPPRPRAMRIPIPFEVDDAMVEWADTELPRFDWERETPKFVDYWKAKSGAQATKVDWPATWRNWMRRASEGMR